MFSVPFSSNYRAVGRGGGRRLISGRPIFSITGGIPSRTALLRVFLVMARRAQRLPVANVVSKLREKLYRLDVVRHIGRNLLPIPQTPLTQILVLAQYLFSPCAMPCAVIVSFHAYYRPQQSGSYQTKLPHRHRLEHHSGCMEMRGFFSAC